MSPANLGISELGPEKGAEFKAAIAKMNASEASQVVGIPTQNAMPRTDAKFEGYQKSLEEAHKAVAAF